MKYVYPALFDQEQSGLYNVSFPDLPECYTCGDDLPDAIAMAEDVLSMYLAELETENKEIPGSSDISSLTGTVYPILANTTEYVKRFSKKSVKKTLSFPEWLNIEAEKRNVNFSRTL